MNCNGTITAWGGEGKCEYVNNNLEKLNVTKLLQDSCNIVACILRRSSWDWLTFLISRESGQTALSVGYHKKTGIGMDRECSTSVV